MLCAKLPFPEWLVKLRVDETYSRLRPLRTISA